RLAREEVGSRRERPEQRLGPVVGRPALIESRDDRRPADVPRAGREPEGAALPDRAFERRDAIAGALRGGEREVQLPRLVRLVDLLDPLQRPRRLPHLARERLRPPPVGPARHLREDAATGARLIATGVQQRLDLAASVPRVLERVVLLLPRQLTGSGEVAPASGVFAQRPRP